MYDNPLENIPKGSLRNRHLLARLPLKQDVVQRGHVGAEFLHRLGMQIDHVGFLVDLRQLFSQHDTLGFRLFQLGLEGSNRRVIIIGEGKQSVAMVGGGIQLAPHVGAVGGDLTLPFGPSLVITLGIFDHGSRLGQPRLDAS